MACGWRVFWSYSSISEYFTNKTEATDRKAMILPVVLSNFLNKSDGGEKIPLPLSGMRATSQEGGSKKETGLVNSCPASPLHQNCFAGQDCVLVKLLQDQHEPSLHALEITQGLDVFVVCDHLVHRVLC